MNGELNTFLLDFPTKAKQIEQQKTSDLFLEDNSANEWSVYWIKCLLALPDCNHPEEHRDCSPRDGEQACRGCGAACLPCSIRIRRATMEVATGNCQNPQRLGCTLRLMSLWIKTFTMLCFIIYLLLAIFWILDIIVEKELQLDQGDFDSSSRSTLHS